MAKKKKKRTPVKTKPARDPQTSKIQDNRAAKKEAVLGAAKPSRKPMFIGLIVVIVALAAGFYVIQKQSSPDYSASTQSSYNNTGNIASQISYPVSLFADGKARHFKYDDGPITVNYFILKSSDGIVRAAFDACDVCWPAGKGYYQDGDDMVCRNCGRRFASVLVNEVKGGCNPAPLTRNIEGDKVILRVNDILEGKTYFDFS